jgi:hypothetical protein
VIQKVVALLLLAATACFPLTKVSVPYRGVPGAAILSSGINRNSDTIYNAYNRMVDTLSAKYTRYTAFKNHDSTFSWMNIDTIKGPVRIDSIAGIVRADTVKAKLLELSGRVLPVVMDTIFACTLYDGTTARATGYGYAARVGWIVTYHLQTLYGTVTSSTATTISGIPPDYRTGFGTTYVASIIYNNGVIGSGLIRVETGSSAFVIQKVNGGYLDAGPGGLYQAVPITVHIKNPYMY